MAHRRVRVHRSVPLDALIIMVVAALTLAASTVVLYLREGDGPTSATPERDRDLSRPMPPPAALIIGDSYTAGTGADSTAGPQGSYACRGARAMGWVCAMDAQGGTGFINDGHVNNDRYEPFLARLDNADARLRADVIIIDGGRNDGHRPVDEVAAAAQTLVEEVHRRWPEAPIVMIVPSYVFSTPATYQFGSRLGQHFREILAPLDGYVIDPLSEEWIPRDRTAAFVWTDGIHPNESAHQLMGERLAEDLRALGLGTVAVTDPPGWWTDPS